MQTGDNRETQEAVLAGRGRSGARATQTSSLPVIDVRPLVEDGDSRAVAEEIDIACRERGFFYIVGHGIDRTKQERMEAEARKFFARPDDEKAAIAMERGGRAWRGWFPVGGELTSGVPDRKEGIYFGAERVADGRPLHGPNLFPAEPEGLRDAVLEWIDAMTSLGHVLARGLALALGLDRDWFHRHLTADPTVLFRIFHYPPGADAWGVGEHTDYGLLTILLQDATGGLQVRTPAGWIDAPPLEGSFVCNLGDMLERMTGGQYRSTPHRVRNTSGADRLSFPFFFDPGWDAEVRAIPGTPAAAGDAADRWDGASVFDFEGTYSEYLIAKVAKVFPALGADVLD
jgi:isopenicillin N synthase-like dioxygenase